MPLTYKNSNCTETQLLTTDDIDQTRTYISQHFFRFKTHIHLIKRTAHLVAITIDDKETT